MRMLLKVTELVHLKESWSFIWNKTEGVCKPLAFSRIMELSYQKTFVPRNKSSIGGTFIPWNFCPQE